MRITSLVGLAFVTPVIAFAGSVAEASTFSFNSSIDPASGVAINNRAGNYEEIKTSFDDETDLFSWSSTFTANNHGNLADGGWLVISDGKNPKGGEQKYTMFYMDGDAEKLTAYTYNGVNGSNSWQDSNSVYLDSWDLSVSEGTDERTFSFDIDMTAINGRTDLGADWEGTSFADEVGIWFHGVNDFEADYNVDGSLKDFGYLSQGWYDSTTPIDTKKVPEPTGMAGMAIAGLFAAKHLRRRQQG